MIGRAGIVFQLALRNLFRNRRRSILMIIAILIGVWSSVSLSLLARGISYQMGEDAIATLLGHMQIHKPGYVDDPAIDYRMPEDIGELDIIIAQPEVKGGAKRVRVPAVLASERQTQGIIFLGVQPDSEQRITFMGGAPIEGRFLTDVDDHGLVIGRKLLELLETKIGRRVVVMSQGGDGEIAERGFRIVGVYDAELESTERTFVYTGLKTAQEMLSIPGEISEVSVVLTGEETPLEQYVSRVRAEVPALQVSSWEELSPLSMALRKVQDKFLHFWFVIVFITISFGLVNTIYMSIAERIREFGLLTALGMRPWMITAQIMIESVLLLAIGCLLGIGMGFLTLWYFQGGIDISAFARGSEVIGVGSLIKPRFLVGDFALAAALIMIFGALGSLYPAWGAAKNAPVSALNRE